MERGDRTASNEKKKTETFYHELMFISDIPNGWGFKVWKHC